MRPLGRSYLQHARRHVPTGSDPIPGLAGGSSWAALDPGQPVSVPPNTFKAVQTGGGSYQFYTNDSSIFTAKTLTTGGHSYPGIQMNTAGHYLVQATLVPASAVPDGVAYGVGPFDNGDADESVFYMTPSARLVPAGENAAFVSVPNGEGAQTLMWTNIQSLGDGFVSAPAYFVAAGKNYDAVATLSVNIYTVIHYLDTDTTFID